MALEENIMACIIAKVNGFGCLLCLSLYVCTNSEFIVWVRLCKRNGAFSFTQARRLSCVNTHAAASRKKRSIGCIFLKLPPRHINVAARVCSAGKKRDSAFTADGCNQKAHWEVEMICSFPKRCAVMSIKVRKNNRNLHILRHLGMYQCFWSILTQFSVHKNYKNCMFWLLQLI